MTVESIAIIVTVDTKEAEAKYLHEFISAHGWDAPVIDVSTRHSHNYKVAFSKEVVSAFGGVQYENLGILRRDEMMQTMGSGAGHILKSLYTQGQLAGVLAVGGNQGTAIAAIAMRTLPIGVPKLIVSTVASGNIRPYVEYKDIAMMFSVSDILGGPNTVSRSILSNAAGALMGMASYGEPMITGRKPVVSVTAFGNTDAAVKACCKLLSELNYEVIAFHASGASGSAMEDIIGQGLIEGVLDLTTHELVGEVFGQDIYTPLLPRLEAAGKLGIPMVIAPGGLDYFCFGPAESIPAPFRDRKTHYHNPYNTNVRTASEELSKVGEVLASKVNASTGPVAILIPMLGWSENGRLGGPLYDPEADSALVKALEDHLVPKVRLIKVDANINDPDFAQIAVQVFRELLQITDNH